ncbi:hypothetical protein [Mesorhizobium loti]|uniref:hypothetical protein n=1 Tax=Rhizobium loti TaxID=381 RepID=UPI001FDA1E1C|nr:hypothetical protein [Mesorhizobium loti]
MLRWGTLDPFVAFALAQGLAKTRDAAAVRRADFEQWLAASGYGADSENKIDPQLYLEWQSSIRRDESDLFDEEADEATLVGTDGRNRRYSVIPVPSDDAINWLDPSGFILARTKGREEGLSSTSNRDDFELIVRPRRVTVSRIFISPQ